MHDTLKMQIMHLIASKMKKTISVVGVHLEMTQRDELKEAAVRSPRIEIGVS